MKEKKIENMKECKMKSTKKERLVSALIAYMLQYSPKQ